MQRMICRVSAFAIVAPYTIRIEFDDHTAQTIDFLPILEGELYGSLQDIHLFGQVVIDPEAHTLAWPNGADFDPETLHDWPRYAADFTAMAKRWAPVHR